MVTTLNDIGKVKSHAELAELIQALERSSGNTGRTSFVVTARGNEVETAFQVVEASTLIPSNTLDGRINPLFPQELQPRDRTRQSSVLQVAKMANSLRPAQLADSGLSSHGAPIVGEDMVVESGNGRTMAITKAYIEGKAEEYKNYLISNASMYGLKAEAVERMSQPVLVRVRRSQVDRAEFAKDSNLSDLTEMAASEKAWVDAENISPAMMAVFEPDASGNLLAKSNQGFIQAFMRSLGDAASAGMLTADGRPTKQLIDRMQNAIFAKAYKNEKLVKLVAEEPDPEIRNVLTALNAAAPEFVEMQYLSGEAHKQASGAVADAVESLDKQALSALVEAAELVRKAKDSGQSVQELISQLGLFGDVSEHAQQLALFIANNNRSAKRMGEAFKLLAKEINAELLRGGSAMGDMFGGGGASLDDVIRAVETQLELDISGGQKNMFEATKKARVKRGHDFDEIALFNIAVESASSHRELANLIAEVSSSGVSRGIMFAGVGERFYQEMEDKIVNSAQADWKAAANSISKALKANDVGSVVGAIITGCSKVAEHRIRGGGKKMWLDALKIVSSKSKWGEQYAAALEEMLFAHVEDDTDTANRQLARMSALRRLLPKSKDGNETHAAIGARAFIEGAVAIHSGLATADNLNAVTNALYEDVALELMGADSIDGGDEIAAEAQAAGADLYEATVWQSNNDGKPFRWTLVNTHGKGFYRFDEAPLPEHFEFIAAENAEKETKVCRKELAQIQRFTGSLPPTLESIGFCGKKDARAYATRTERLIVMGKDDRCNARTLWHEMGHHIEFSYPEIRAAARAFLVKRAKGQPVRQLKAIYPKIKYEVSEIAVEDGFKRHYTSKIYAASGTGGRIKSGDDLVAGLLISTEIISMGFQYLYGELTGLDEGFGSDTEFRDLMFGILKGLRDGKYKVGAL